MLRVITFLIAVSSALVSEVLPEQFGEYRRGAPAAAALDNRAVWDEYGLEAAERAPYSSASGSFVLTAFRFKDPTGSFAAFQWRRPADAQSGLQAATVGTGSLVQHLNYLLHFEEGKPHPQSLQTLYAKLPGIVSSSLPTLFAYLPRQGRVSNSERYLLGPASLSLLEPRISPKLAAFDRGAEAQVAKYRLGSREVQLTIFSYPTPQMAMDRLNAFRSLNGAALRRTGPLLLVIPEAAGFEPAEKLLAGINYNASLMWNEQAPKDTVQDAAEMILAISALAIGLILSSVLLGMLFGGSKILMRRLGMKVADEEFTSLHLGSK